MKEYTVPEITMLVDDLGERNYALKLAGWRVDEEACEVIVECAYEEVSRAEFLRAQGVEVRDDLELLEDDHDEEEGLSCYFRKLESPAALMKIACDQPMAAVTNEWDDERGHHVETLTSAQNVAFELGWNEELMDQLEWSDGLVSMEAEELRQRVLAVKKNGVYWFVDFRDLKLLTITEFDDEEEDDVDVPLSLKTMTNVCEGTPYVKGSEPWEPEADVLYPEEWRGNFLLVGEDEAGNQYGMEMTDHFCDVVKFNRVWDKITVINGSYCLNNAVLLKEADLDEGHTYQAVTWGLDYVLDNCNTEYHNCDGMTAKLMDIPGVVWSYERKPSKILCTIVGKNVTLHLMPGTGNSHDTIREDLKGLALYDGLTDVLARSLQLKIEAQVKDDVFVLSREKKVGRGSRKDYYVLDGDQPLGTVYDDAQILSMECGEVLFAVKKDGYWGVIDRTGTVVIPFAYSKIFKAETVEKTQLPGDAEAIGLQQFGTAGAGYLKPVIVKEAAQNAFQIDLDIFGFAPDDESEEAAAEKIVGWEFVQTVACVYEKAAPMYGQVFVEKMGRSAVYDLMTGAMVQGFEKKQ